MTTIRLLKLGLQLGPVVAALASSVWAAERAPTREVQIAALALPTGARADWRQWDSFFTFAVKRLGQELRPAQRDQVGEVFLDARYQLTQTVASGAPTRCPVCF